MQQIQASQGAFAAILLDGSVVTWGGQDFGGDSRAVQDQLKGVQQIQASERVFAAIMSDGSVVTWGVEAEFPGILGSDSRAVRGKISREACSRSRPFNMVLRFLSGQRIGC